jgi:uncharacterized protein YdhG (YjbR/CyaY superfamily)
MSNMFKPVKAKTVAQYIAALPPERRAAIRALDALIRKTVPKLKPHFAYNMLGYGAFPYRNYKKELISWPVISLASQKNYISVYVCALEGRAYLAEKYKKELGKVSVGRSCIRFRKPEDLHLPTFTKVLKLAAKAVREEAKLRLAS